MQKTKREIDYAFSQCQILIRLMTCNDNTQHYKYKYATLCTVLCTYLTYIQFYVQFFI